MKLVLVFLVVFLLGPVLFWSFARHRPTRQRIVALMGAALVLMGVAFALGHWAVPAFSASHLPGLAVICSIWLAWIAMLAGCALAVQYRLTSARARKFVFAIGAMAVTLPWFGLYISLLAIEK